MAEAGFAQVKSVWQRRAARDAVSKRQEEGEGQEDANAGSLLLQLPPELLIMVCAAPELGARDLVALELTCSSFRRRLITEEAAKAKLQSALHERSPSSSSSSSPSTPLHEGGDDQQGHSSDGARVVDSADGGRDDRDGEALPASLADLLKKAPQTGPTSSRRSINFKRLVHHLLEDHPLPTFVCPRCAWHVGGFRCQGHRPPRLARGWDPVIEYGDNEEPDPDAPPVPVPTGCGCYLAWNAKEERLFCPMGCGSTTAPACCCKAYRRNQKDKQKDEKERSETKPIFKMMKYMPSTETYPTLRSALSKLRRSEPAPPWRTDDEGLSPTLQAMWDGQPPIRKKTPAMTCIQCGFTVADYVCLGRPGNSDHQVTAPPRLILQEGFYERVWCCYRFCCSDTGCSVIRGGTEAPDGQNDSVRRDRALLCCMSMPQCVTSRFAYREDQHGRVGVEMATLEWHDELGPATNYYPYRCVKPK